MKRHLILSLALVALMGLASCSDDNSTNTYSYTVATNNRALTATNVDATPYFSQTSTSIELDLTNYTIVVNTSALFNDEGDGISFATPTMTLTYDNSMASGTYAFKSSSVNTSVSQLQGMIDLTTGTLYMSYQVDGEYQVYATSQLLYTYCNTTISAESASPYSHIQSSYCFLLDESGKTCTMQISNFIGSNSGVVLSSTLNFPSLTLTPTSTGYKVTAVEAKSSSSGDGAYKLEDVNVVIDRQGRTVMGSFTYDDRSFVFKGSMLDSNS